MQQGSEAFALVVVADEEEAVGKRRPAVFLPKASKELCISCHSTPLWTTWILWGSVL